MSRKNAPISSNARSRLRRLTRIRRLVGVKERKRTVKECGKSKAAGIVNASARFCGFPECRSTPHLRFRNLPWNRQLKRSVLDREAHVQRERRDRFSRGITNTRRERTKISLRSRVVHDFPSGVHM